MRQIFKIAIRSIKRNIRRTIITIITICIGVFVIVVVQGFLDGLHEGLVNNITKSRTGHISFFQKDYSVSEESFNLDLALNDDIVSQILTNEGVLIEHHTKRLTFGGMLNSGERSSMFVGMGVEPEKEGLVCPYLLDNIVDGKYLSSEQDSETGVAEAVITSSLARSLNVKCGDVLTILSKTKYGALNAIDIEVVGLLTDRLPLSNSKLVLLPISHVQFLLQMDSEFTEFTVTLKDIKKIEEVESVLNAKLLPLDIVPWYVSAKIFKDIMNLQNAVFLIVMVVLLIIVVSSIVNTMLMSVYDRVKEIGTMLAIGMLRRDIIILFLTETICLGLFGGIIGLIISSVTILYFNINGFSYIVAPGTDFPLVIYPILNVSNLIFAFIFSIFASIISAAYPAYKAASLLPTVALRNDN